MKKKASALLKQIVALVSSIAKAKSMAIKNKTSAFKARLVMLSLMKNKKLMFGSISNKIHNLLGHQDEHAGDHDQSKAMILHDVATANELISGATQVVEECYDNDDKYPDLTHSLFDEDGLDFDDEGGSIIDLVRNSKEDEGKSFHLEDEIDHVADLFISRFHKQMRLQKLLSFKRHQEMIERNV